MYTIFTKENCTYCIMAKKLLDERGEQWVAFDVYQDDNLSKLTEKLGRQPKTVPQIWSPDNTYIGGFEELKALLYT